MRQKFLSRLVVNEAETPLVWASTAQPLVVKDGWKLAQKLPDGCIYSHSKHGLASYRGLEDDAGRKWMHLTLPCTGNPRFEDVDAVRRFFFPDQAIVCLAIEPDGYEIVHLWWAIDGKGLPMDAEWRAMMTPE